jgi:hypothetical protein
MDAQLNVRSAFSSYVLRYVVCSSHVTHIVLVIVSRDSCLEACIESLRLSMKQGLDCFGQTGCFVGSCLANGMKQVLMALGGRNSVP